jgi:polar amino acid transport system substrate-binding protein
MIARLSRHPRAVYSLALLITALLPLLLTPLTLERFPSPAEVFENGVLRVGIDAGFPPFGMIIDDTYAGIDADLAAAIADKLGLRLELIQTNFDGAYDSVMVGRADLVLAGLPIDSGRTNDVTYTWAYFDDGLMLASPSDATILTGEALSGLLVAVEFGSPADSELRLWTRRVRGISPVQLTSARDAALAVAENAADVALLDPITCAASGLHCERLTHLLISGIVRADRRAVHFHINRAILDLLNDGTVDAILARHIPGLH